MQLQFEYCEKVSRRLSIKWHENPTTGCLKVRAMMAVSNIYYAEIMNACIGSLMANSLESDLIKETNAITNLNMSSGPINTLAVKSNLFRKYHSKSYKTQTVKYGDLFWSKNDDETIKGFEKVLETESLLIGPHLIMHSEYYKFHRAVIPLQNKTNPSYKKTNSRNIGEDLPKSFTFEIDKNLKIGAMAYMYKHLIDSLGNDVEIIKKYLQPYYKTKIETKEEFKSYVGKLIMMVIQKEHGNCIIGEDTDLKIKGLVNEYLLKKGILQKKN
ncbi:hypothetical protein ACTFIT_005077 [Dictyostelium discoideum]